MFLGYELALGGWTLAASLAAATALLVWLHRRRQRRRRVLVSFEPLWAHLPGGTGQEALSGKLRRHAPLLLQLAVICALLAAAADPRRPPRAGVGQAVVILVDSSASMATREGSGTRLGLARSRARQVLAGLGNDDRALIAGFAERVAPETGLIGDRAQLDRALARLRAREARAALEPALAFARAALIGERRPRVVVITDDAKLLSGVQADAQRAAPELHLVGAPADNLAIVAFNVAPATGATRTGLAGGYRAQVTLRSFARERQRAEVELRDQAGRVLARGRTELVPGSRVTLPLTVVAPEATGLEARLNVPGAGANQLALDDRAFASLPRARPRRILTVGPRNLYLEGALLGLEPEYAVSSVDSPERLTDPGSLQAYDLVIFDGVTPSAPPRSGRFLFIDPSGRGSPFVERGRIKAPVPSQARREHPLLAHLSLADLNISEARHLVLGRDDEAVVSALGTPLLITRRQPGLKLCALAFDPRRSDLPLRPAFPLLLANIADWLTAGTEAGHGGSFAAESSAVLPVAEGVKEVRVTDPGDALLRWPVVNGQAHIELGPAGFYRLAQPGPASTLAASFADPGESDTQQTGQAAVAKRLHASHAAGGDPAAATGTAPVSRHLAPWLLALAGALAAVEWARARRQRRQQNRAAKTIGRALQVLFAAALATAAAGVALTLPRAFTPSHLVVLGDRSDSVQAGALDQALAGPSRLRGSLRPGQRLQVIDFAGQPWRAPDAAGTAVAAPINRSRTDLGLALATGLAAIDPDAAGGLLLLSDGRSTSAGMSAALLTATRLGLPIFVGPLPSRQQADVAMLGLRAVGDRRPGARFALEASLGASVSGQARLRLTRDGHPTAIGGDRELVFAPGVTTTRWFTEVPGERTLYRVQIVEATANDEKRNDEAQLAVAGARAPRVLVIADQPGGTAGFRRALAAQQMHVDVLSSAAAGADPQAALANRELVVLAHVAPARLRPQLAQAIAHLVRDQGGGLLVAGDPMGWGGGGYERTGAGVPAAAGT